MASPFWLSSQDRLARGQTRSACRYKGTVEEERRLFYVAVTRAWERLYLFHAPYRHAWSGHMFAEPSQFLTENAMSTLILR
ncbi:3'-5' exonuclease [Paraburkholderia phytofirmans]|uniref:3'-5' exonuclease n=1 Tax=Paraburkholderia phytofirmans TaxID=261302 RepID=UPI0009EEC344|nr:3'-5' exonuclease [Paraburkholderia phytofirmans]